MSTLVTESTLLSLREVAGKLAVSEKTVRRFIDSGQLPALRVGRQLRVDPEELQRWLYSIPPRAKEHR
jgi:excisionase family DNA binding protein